MMAEPDSISAVSEGPGAVPPVQLAPLAQLPLFPPFHWTVAIASSIALKLARPRAPPSLQRGVDIGLQRLTDRVRIASATAILAYKLTATVHISPARGRSLATEGMHACRIAPPNPLVAAG